MSFVPFILQYMISSILCLNDFSVVQRSFVRQAVKLLLLCGDIVLFIISCQMTVLVVLPSTPRLLSRFWSRLVMCLVLSLRLRPGREKQRPNSCFLSAYGSFVTVRCNELAPTMNTICSVYVHVPRLRN
jgi:hypothetical protein